MITSAMPSTPALPRSWRGGWRWAVAGACAEVRCCRAVPQALEFVHPLEIGTGVRQGPSADLQRLCSCPTPVPDSNLCAGGAVPQGLVSRILHRIGQPESA